jgi:hypothetical protein
MTFPGLVRANNLNDVVDRERAWDNLGANISANIPIPSPSLDLNFASNKSLVDNVSGQNLITFTRPSTGTFVGSNGLIQTAASGVPRFDHDPATGESLGLLVEEARTNLTPNSMPTTAGGSGGGLTNTLVTGLPGIFSTGRRLTSSGGNDVRIIIDGTIGTNGVTYTFSFFARLGTQGNSIFTRLGTTAYTTWNLSTGTITNNGFGNAQIVNCGNGWYRCSSAMPGSPGAHFLMGVGDSGLNAASGDNIIIAGVQNEVGTFPTSYIPTSGAIVTRNADVMQITGANLSSFYNAGRGTIYAEQFRQAGTGGVAIGDTASNRLLDWQSSRIYRTSWGGVNYTWTGAPAVSATSLNRAALAYGQTVQGSVNGSLYVLSPLIVTASFPTTSLAFQGAFSRIVFWGDQLPSSTIAAITSISNVQIGALPSSYTTNATTLGKDIAALNAVRNASTRDFVFIKGLLSAAQPRLTTAAALASSGTASQNASLLKASPTTAGNFFINRGGIVASGLRVNNTNIASLSSSAFSGSTALFPIVVSSLKLSLGLQWAPAMTSGTVTSPGKAIPIETSEFILFAKAGQS